ncbi:fucose-specific lectin [Hypoxylon sp. NC0597]|nr:fucose-specific lectin [Hypoxylon sp. NC0597]
MASTGYHDAQPDQPGLEVLQYHTQSQYDSGLQVAPPDQKWLHSVQVEKEYREPPQAGLIVDESNPAPRKRNIKKVVLIVIGCVLVIVGVVVGAAVGTQKSRSSSSSLSSSPVTTSPSGQGDSAQGDGEAGTPQAEMTGSPTSVAPGLAPTAISWGYPHMEIFALTNNDTYSIYRKYRNSNASSEMAFLPQGTDMELVGGGIDTNSAPSIAVNHRIEAGRTNRTELHINGKGGGYRKYHDADELWMNLDPNGWDTFENAFVIGAPAEVQYEPSVDIMKVFYLGKSDSGIAAYYFQWHRQDSWSNAIQLPGPDLQPMTPAVVAWNRNDTRIDLFAVSRANSHLLHASWNAEADNWTAYEDLRGFVTTPPVAVSRTPGIIDVFARGGDAGLWHISYNDGNGNWTNWTRIGTKIQGQPDAISVTSDSLDVFAWGQDGSMLHKSYDSVSNSWTPSDEFDVLVNGTLSGPPKSMSDAPGNLHVFAYNNNNELIWKTLGSAQSADTVTLANVPMVST